MSIRSHPTPQQPARKRPAVDIERADRCTEAVRDVAEDSVIVSDALLNRAFDPTATATELLDLFNTLARLAQEGTEALVVCQRSQGKPLSELAPKLNLTEDRIRKKYNPATIDQNLATRTRPMRTPHPTTTNAGDVPTTKDLLRQPRQRLACALTRMRKQSGVPQRTLARHMNIDPSYVSRMLSGERDITLQHVKNIVDKCGGNLDLVQPLWETAYGIEPTTDPVRALRSYLHALHYAAGSPTHERILDSVEHTITKPELRQALDGRGVPDWPVVRQLTVALQSLPEITRPLWRKAQAEAGSTITISAAAFG
ncbi:helix-turn-helix domain-containing protein [Streptomyces sp. NPDC006976]|uniref:helix-turn-helix domain-containing protein n=1 Tax=Streptomyces sp. NPDC006976 TaxID=3154311 RepID=UPI003403AFAD